jgi:hypothetical protein
MAMSIFFLKKIIRYIKVYLILKLDVVIRISIESKIPIC